MKLNQIIIGMFCLLCTAQTWAIHNTPGEHWFEIEVILFSQIGDKSVLKEKFDAAPELPKYSRYLDLLNPYLQPDIQALKQLLPYCDSPSYPLNVDYSLFTEAQLKAEFDYSTNMNIKALQEMQQEIQQEALTAYNGENSNLQNTEFHSDTSGGAGNGLTDELSDVVNDQEDDFYSSVNKASAPASLPAIITSENSTAESNDITGSDIAESLTDEQLALIAEAEKTFAPEQEKKIVLLPTKNLIGNKLCVWSSQYYDNLRLSNPSLPSYNGLIVEELSGKINGTEQLYSNSPYLISKESLQLGDINKQLSLSKNFKPLLHFGWRQHTLNKKRALPLKVFAGDNLKHDYQKELQQREEDKALLLAQEENLLDILALNADVDVDVDVDNENSEKIIEENEYPVDEKEQAITLRIQEIIEQIAQAPTDIDALINEEELPLQETSELLIDEPEQPVQPWYLDGFIKVHVEHYLHVTTDINIMNKTLAEQKHLHAKASALEQENSITKTSEAIEIKPINFKQDRRVISGEIHYFDHPYMGMVLQVRRYKKPEPPHIHDEEVEHVH